MNNTFTTFNNTAATNTTNLEQDLKRNSLKGTHNKNIFSFDDRYYMTHLADQVISNNSNVSELKISTHHHQHAPSMPPSTNSPSPSSPLQRHTSNILSKRQIYTKHKHHSSIVPPFDINNLESQLLGNIKIDKMEEKNVRILILNNFRSVSKRVKLALLEIIKYRKVVLGDKTFDVPFEFVCICDTLELPTPLVSFIAH